MMMLGWFVEVCGSLRWFAVFQWIVILVVNAMSLSRCVPTNHFN